MEHHSLLTDWLQNAGLPVPDEIVMATVVALLLALFALIAGRRLSITAPGTVQQGLEVALASFVGLMESVIPHHARRHLPILGTFAFFIVSANLLGMIPGFTSATASASVTLGLAVISFAYYNAVGIRELGAAKHVLHLFGPVWWLGWLMFPIEVVAHVARNLSLSMRLFGNIYGEHSATALFAGIFPYGLPLPMMALGLFGALLQTFIFCVLSMVYIALAIEH